MGCCRSSRLDRGRIMVSTREIAPGEVVLRSIAYTQTISDNCKFDFCSKCFIRLKNPLNPQAKSLQAGSTESTNDGERYLADSISTVGEVSSDQQEHPNSHLSKQDDPTVLPCSQCNEVGFCSRDCMQTSEHTEWECNALQRLHHPVSSQQ